MMNKSFSLLVVIILVLSCHNAKSGLTEDMAKLFRYEVENSSKNMLKLIHVEEVRINKMYENSDGKKMANIKYLVTVELKEPAWAWVDNEDKVRNFYSISKQKPSPTEFYGRGVKPKLFSKGDSYTIVRNVDRVVQ